jgi:hypothetical protein
MGTARRAYDLLRGYVNQEYDRIRGVDLDEAQRELDDALNGYPASSTAGTTATMDSTQPPVSREERARNILGVGPTASFEEIRRSFERLNKRGDPSRFPLNSEEREHAASIQKSVQWAYSVLTANMDSVEKRFKSLEIE